MNEYFQKKILKYKNIKICEITDEDQRGRRNHYYHGTGLGAVLIAIVPPDAKLGHFYVEKDQSLRA